jgi:hypothetical protein
MTPSAAYERGENAEFSSSPHWDPHRDPHRVPGLIDAVIRAVTPRRDPRHDLLRRQQIN